MAIMIFKYLNLKVIEADAYIRSSENKVVV